MYNTLLEDADLMRLLFSLLDAEPPLDCKTAGYFGRVVGQLLLRKTNEMMQYCQENPQILERLIGHIDTMSIADIVKRFVGADEHSSILFMPAYAQWLADTPLVELLLQRLGAGFSSDVQTNAAEVLSAIAHTQPSPLASKLTHDDSIATLFQHALQPGKAVLVAALDVCTALVEPKRSNPELLNDGSPMQVSLGRLRLGGGGAASRTIGCGYGAHACMHACEAAAPPMIGGRMHTHACASAGAACRRQRRMAACDVRNMQPAVARCPARRCVFRSPRAR